MKTSTLSLSLLTDNHLAFGEKLLIISIFILIFCKGPTLMHIFIVLNRLLFSRIDMRKLMQRHYLMSGGYYF
jgi:hypothetical protein